MPLETQFGAEGMAVRKQIEEIKNRNGGNPPDKAAGLGPIGEPDASGVPGTYEPPVTTTPAGSVGKGFTPVETPRVDNTALALPVEGVDSSVSYAGESAGLRPSRFQPKAEGADVTEPSPSYPDAHKKAKADTNLWVRQAPEVSNADRVLLVQITPDLMYPDGPDPVSTPYYDKLYSGTRPGYARGTSGKSPGCRGANIGQGRFYVRNVARPSVLEKSNWSRGVSRGAAR
jgi:hypothetical protein